MMPKNMKLKFSFLGIATLQVKHKTKLSFHQNTQDYPQKLNYYQNT